MQVDSHMKFRTTRDILKGEVIVQAPCHGPSVDTLIATGFVSPPVPNMWDFALLEVIIDEKDPLFKLKLELLE